MKTKMIRGKEVFYAESAREMRSMLPEEVRNQLMTQTGSAVAICTAKTCDGNLTEYCNALNRSGNFRFSYSVRREFIRKSDFRVLVSHRTDNDLFSLVGGARKLCESFEDTAMRELGEESGLTLNDLLFLGLISGGDEMINIYPDGNAAEGVDALYLAMVPRGTVTRPDAETREFIWMTPDEINAALSLKRWHPAQVKTMQKLLVSLLQLPEILLLKAEAPQHW